MERRKAIPERGVWPGAGVLWELTVMGERGPVTHLGIPQCVSPFQILAFLLRKKTAFLNHRIFQLILSVAGTAELGFRPSAVTNTCVFQHVLCNFEVNWRLMHGPSGVCVCMRIKHSKKAWHLTFFHNHIDSSWEK